MNMKENEDKKQDEDLVESIENEVQQKEEIFEAKIKTRESHIFQIEVLCVCTTVGTKYYEFGQTREITKGVQENKRFVHEEQQKGARYEGRQSQENIIKRRGSTFPHGDSFK